MKTNIEYEKLLNDTSNFFIKEGKNANSILNKIDKRLKLDNFDYLKIKKPSKNKKNKPIYYILYAIRETDTNGIVETAVAIYILNKNTKPCKLNIQGKLLEDYANNKKFILN